MEKQKPTCPKHEITPELIARYQHIFDLQESIPERLSKRAFDILISLSLILILSPLYIAIFIAYIIEGIFNRNARGPFFSTYLGADRGRKFKKYKFRVVKGNLINKKIMHQLDISAYPSEHGEGNVTLLGKFLRKYYLDELPQLFNILLGDMSIVGPRAYAWHDYLHTIKRGHISRKILKAGLFSYTHISKHTENFSNAELDYIYIDEYLKLSAPALIFLDIKIILKGILMVLRGKGYLPANTIAD